MRTDTLLEGTNADIHLRHRHRNIPDFSRDFCYHDCTMVTLNAHFDGKAIVPDEPLSLAPNQKLRITIESIDPAQVLKSNRVPGLQRDALISISPEFNAHLGDDFWGIADTK